MEAGPIQFEEFAAEARERFARIESRLDLSATKSDLSDLRAEMHREFASMTKWVVGTALVLGAAAITVITFVLNYATPPKTSPAPQVLSSSPPPIVIQLPPYPGPRQ
jgi:hypothetical protein